MSNRRLSAEQRRAIIERTATELFAERGYGATSMEVIARASGVSVPVVYDHFASKEDLHRRLLELHYAELRAIWRRHLLAGGSYEERFAGAVDAWFAYVEAHPYAWKMLFRDATGESAAEAVRREVAAQSRAALLGLVERDPSTQADYVDERIEMRWEIVRGVLQGLALWWYDNRHVPRELVVDTALHALTSGIGSGSIRE